MRPNQLLLSFCALAIVSLAPTLSGQPGQRGPSSILDVSFSHSGPASAEFAGRSGGDLSVNASSVGVLLNRSLRPDLQASLGVEYRHFGVEVPAGVPVPGTLQALSLRLAATLRFDSAWSATLALSPGLFSAGTSLDGDGFNAPGLLIATWRSSATFSLSGGIRFDAFSDNPVLPILGFRWQASPSVLVSLGAPRTEVAFTLSPDTDLFAGASFQGGSFRIDDPGLRPPPGYPHLRDTYVDYREIRLGLGARWAASPTVRLEVEAGWLADRRFDYYDRLLEVKTDGALYGRVGVTARF